MNFPFKHKALAALLLLLAAQGFAAQPDLFSLVPKGDATYAGLAQLASVGWVPAQDTRTPLTRFEVAKLLALAEEKAGAIVLAQADDIPAPDETEPSAAEPSGTVASPAPEVPASSETTSSPAASSNEFGDELEAAGPGTVSSTGGVLDDSPEALRKALKTLRTLKQAYDYEVGRLKGGIKNLDKQVTDLESDQYDLRRRLKGIEQYPTVAMHGTGRALGWWQNNWGNWPGQSFFPVKHATWAFLDMGPEGHVSKEVRWKAMFRFGSNLLPNNNPIFTVRRLEIEFNPPWMDLDVCDFEESYTPLTLWNRNSLDLRYFPEPIAKEDKWRKYESFLDHEPNWPLRGARASTRVQWEEGSIVESLKASVFAHMIRNGFNDTNGDGWYFGPFLHTDWLFGAKAALSTHDLWVGSSPVKFTLDAQGVMLDQDMGSDSPIGAPYFSTIPLTWAHQYLVGSLKPEVRLGGEAGLGVCLGMEYAQSHYQDDQLVPGRVFDDFAMLGGISLKWEDSSISLNYLNVGPYFYSPMAQLRQNFVAITAPSSIFDDNFPLLTQTLLSQVPRPGALYMYYDRTRDNTFPYGLGTPNREGFGGELNLKFLQKDALKLLGSVYYAWEITGNLVVNGAGTGFVPVENPLGPTVQTRKFLYVNLGPSIDLGPLVGLPGPLEFGVNVRYEKTESGFGDLTSMGVDGGFLAEIFPFWRVSGSVGIRNVEGSEMGLAGTLLARYPYLYDNSDMGNYSSFTVNGQNQVIRISNTFPVNKNSTIHLSGGIATTNLLPWGGPQGNWKSEFAELDYEITF